jgi:hypothetical protein
MVTLETLKEFFLREGAFYTRFVPIGNNKTLAKIRERLGTDDLGVAGYRRSSCSHEIGELLFRAEQLQARVCELELENADLLEKLASIERADYDADLYRGRFM